MTPDAIYIIISFFSFFHYAATTLSSSFFIITTLPRCHDAMPDIADISSFLRRFHAIAEVSPYHYALRHCRHVITTYEFAVT